MFGRHFGGISGLFLGGFERCLGCIWRVFAEFLLGGVYKLSMGLCKLSMSLSLLDQPS